MTRTRHMFLLAPLLAFGCSGALRAEPREGPRNPPDVVNPMTGQWLGTERLARELELHKLRTLIAQERLKTAAAELDLELLPARRDAERGRLQTAALPMPAPRPPVAEPPMPRVAAPAAVARPWPITETTLPAPPRGFAPQVSGIVRIGPEHLALVERGSETALVRSGEIAFGQQIGEVRSDSVIVNGVRVPRPVVAGRTAHVDRQGGTAAAAALPTPVPPRALALPAVPPAALSGVAAAQPLAW